MEELKEELRRQIRDLDDWLEVYQTFGGGDLCIQKGAMLRKWERLLRELGEWELEVYQEAYDEGYREGYFDAKREYEE